MEMSIMQKIDCWAKITRAEHKINKINKRLKMLIPITVRRRFFMQTIIKARKKYQKLMQDYINKHNLS